MHFRRFSHKLKIAKTGDIVLYRKFYFNFFLRNNFASYNFFRKLPDKRGFLKDQGNKIKYFKLISGV